MDFSDDLSTFFTTTDGPYNVNDQNNAADVYMRQPNATVEPVLDLELRRARHPHRRLLVCGPLGGLERGRDRVAGTARRPGAERDAIRRTSGAAERSPPSACCPAAAMTPPAPSSAAARRRTGDFGSPPERDAVSEDGSRIFFTGLTNQQELFMRT